MHVFTSHKARYRGQSQARSYLKAKGHIHSQLTYLDLQRHNSYPTIFITQGRSPEVPGLLYGISSKCWLCTRVSHDLFCTPPQTNADGLRTAPKHEDDVIQQPAPIPSLLLGYFLRSRDLHLAEFLCQPIFVLAKIQGRAQECRYNLSKIVPRCRLP